MEKKACQASLIVHPVSLSLSLVKGSDVGGVKPGWNVFFLKWSKTYILSSSWPAWTDVHNFAQTTFRFSPIRYCTPHAYIYSLEPNTSFILLVNICTWLNKVLLDVWNQFKTFSFWSEAKPTFYLRLDQHEPMQSRESIQNYGHDHRQASVSKTKPVLSFQL